MGVNSLLQQIPKPQLSTTSNLKNLRLAIDGHCIIHRCCKFAAKAVMIDDNITSMVKYIVKYLKVLLEYADQQSILIFDGGCVEAKNVTKSKKKEYVESLTCEGQKGKYYSEKAFRISRNQLQRLVAELTAEFTFLTILLSPCEADAQIAYMVNSNLADVAVTIDSDLLLYDVKMAAFKFDPKTKHFDFYQKQQIYKEKLANKDNNYLKKLSVLAGCDYVLHLKNVGWVKIWKIMNENGGNVLKSLNLLSQLRGVQLPDGYKSLDQVARDIVKALLTFKYHVVFDPILQIFRNMEEIQKEDKKLIQIIGGQFFGREQDDVEQCLEQVSGGQFNTQQIQTVKKIQELKVYAENTQNTIQQSMSVYNVCQILKIKDGWVSGDGFSFNLHE